MVEVIFFLYFYYNCFWQVIELVIKRPKLVKVSVELHPLIPHITCHFDIVDVFFVIENFSYCVLYHSKVALFINCIIHKPVRINPESIFPNHYTIQVIKFGYF